MSETLTNNFQEIQLTISPDYVKNWGFWEAIRELLQNGIDAKLNGSDLLVRPVGNDLEIITTKAVLSVQTLLLGKSEKPEGSIGQFGEGYKLALLVLTRIGKQVRVRTWNQEWTVMFKHSEVFGQEIMTILIETLQSTAESIVITVHDCADDWNAVKNKYLPDAKPDTILLDRPAGCVYVGGLFVVRIDKFKYAYNFSPGTLKLDRDRGMAADFDVSFAASCIWSRQANYEEIYANLKSDSPDTKYISSYVPSSSAVSVGVYKEFLKSVDGDEEVIPVSTQEEIAKMKGGKFRLVPQSLKEILWAVKKFAFPRTSPAKKIRKLLKKFKTEIPFDMAVELELIAKELE